MTLISDESCSGPNKMRYWNKKKLIGYGKASKESTAEACMDRCLEEDTCIAMVYDNDNKYVPCVLYTWLCFQPVCSFGWRDDATVTSAAKCDTDTRAKQDADGIYSKPGET